MLFGTHVRRRRKLLEKTTSPPTNAEGREHDDDGELRRTPRKLRSKVGVLRLSHAAARVPLKERHVHDVPAKPTQQPRLESRAPVDLDGFAPLEIMTGAVNLDASLLVGLRHVERDSLGCHVFEDVRRERRQYAPPSFSR